MENNFKYRFLFVMILLSGSFLVRGNECSNDLLTGSVHSFIVSPVMDSLPDTKKAKEDKDDKSSAETVKEVTKARRQVKPVALPATAEVKPIKIIKPKIIKPVLKGLH